MSTLWARRGERVEKIESEPKRRGERGFSAIITVMLLLPLLGFAGLAVDVGHWYDRAAEVQKAADAAALAGVVHLPDDAEATTIALEAAKRNGYEHGVDGVTVVVERFPGSDNRLKVTITDTEIPLFFADLFISDVDIERSALAEFARSIPMGNPENRLGTDPEEGIINDYYLSISAGNEYKKGGDRHADKGCDSSTANCSNGSTGNLISNGGEYREEGYLYALRVKQDLNMPLVLEVFDAAHNAADQECDNPTNMPNGYFGSGADDDLLDGDLQVMFPDDGTNDAEYLAHWAERYANSPGAAYCTGDTGGNSNSAQLVTFVMRGVDDTPWNNLDNPIISTGTCTAQQFEPWHRNKTASLLGVSTWDSRNNFYELLARVEDGATTEPGMSANAFAEQFRRWNRICEIPPADVEVGDYILQVRTNAAAGAPLVYASGQNGSGRNHYSLRGGWDNGGSAPDGTAIELFALGTMAIDSNVPGADAYLDLARITPEYQGQTLEIELWDVGDASAGGDYTLLPPSESSSVFTGCQFSNTNTAWSGDSDSSDCHVGVSNSGMNGHLLTALVKIPDDYTCAAADPAGCFVRVLIDYPTGAKVFDHTTWSAGVANDPLRLIE